MEVALKKDAVLSRGSDRIIAVFVFTIFMILRGFVRIPLPFSPVPVTLQTFFVLLSGAFLGSAGVIPQLAYILLGVAGLPVFSGAGSGLLYFLGPTGGYLFGFIVAAFFVSRSIKYAQDSLPRIFIILCLADLVLLLCGVIWLKFLFGYPFQKLLFIGLLPFLPGDLFKAASAAVIYRKLKQRF